jgi:hypothetical protein
MPFALALRQLWRDERGTALTNHTPFYVGLVLLGALAWHFGGHQVQHLVHTVATTLPPAGPATFFR